MHNTTEIEIQHALAKDNSKDEWEYLFNRIQLWYGDIQKRQTHEDFVSEMKEKFTLSTAENKGQQKGDKPEELQEVERLRLVASEYGKLIDQVRQQLKVAIDEIYRLKNK